MSLAAPAAETDAAEDAVGDEPPAGPLARIQSVEIENLRGIRTGKLEGLAPLTILTGPNGSGKSTVLDALDIGGSPNPAEAVRDCVLRRPAVPGGARWLLWRGGYTQARLNVTVGPTQVVRQTLIGFRENKTPGSFNAVYGRLRDFLSSAKPEGIKFQANFYPTGKVNISESRSELQGVSEVLLAEGLGVGTGEPPNLHDTFSTLLRAGRRREADQVGRRLFEGVDHLEILTDGGRAMLGLVWDDHAIPAQLGGDGAYAALRISLELLAAIGGVALIEEPEAHLHPAAMMMVAKAIVNAVRGGTQVVLTTHSIEFLDCLLEAVGDDAAELLALFMVNLRDGELVNARFGGDEVRFSRETIAEDLR